MRGIKGHFSRRKLVERHNLERLEEIWISPSIPRWGYTPIQPFRLVHVNLDGDHLFGFDSYTALAKALHDFGNCHQPTQREACGIVDGRDKMIISWSWDDPDEEPYWWGCEFTFDVLDHLQIQEGWSVTVAHWESIAKGNS